MHAKQTTKNCKPFLKVSNECCCTYNVIHQSLTIFYMVNNIQRDANRAAQKIPLHSVLNAVERIFEESMQHRCPGSCPESCIRQELDFCTREPISHCIDIISLFLCPRLKCYCSISKHCFLLWYIGPQNNWVESHEELNIWRATQKKDDL